MSIGKGLAPGSRTRTCRSTIRCNSIENRVRADHPSASARFTMPTSRSAIPAPRSMIGILAVRNATSRSPTRFHAVGNRGVSMHILPASLDDCERDRGQARGESPTTSRRAPAPHGDSPRARPHAAAASAREGATPLTRRDALATPSPRIGDEPKRVRPSPFARRTAARHPAVNACACTSDFASARFTAPTEIISPSAASRMS